MQGANTRIHPRLLHEADIFTALKTYERVGLHVQEEPLTFDIEEIKYALGADTHKARDPIFLIPEPIYRADNSLKIWIRWCGDDYGQRVHFSPQLGRFARDLQIKYEEKFDAEIRKVYLEHHRNFSTDYPHYL